MYRSYRQGPQLTKLIISFDGQNFSLNLQCWDFKLSAWSSTNGVILVNLKIWNIFTKKFSSLLRQWKIIYYILNFYSAKGIADWWAVGRLNHSPGWKMPFGWIHHPAQSLAPGDPLPSPAQPSPRQPARGEGRFFPGSGGQTAVPDPGCLHPSCWVHQGFLFTLIFF